MGKMSEINIILKDIWKTILFIIIIDLVMCVANLMQTVHIAELEERLTQQEEYMHQVQADIDNLYRLVE